MYKGYMYNIKYMLRGVIVLSDTTLANTLNYMINYINRLTSYGSFLQVGMHMYHAYIFI